MGTPLLERRAFELGPEQEARAATAANITMMAPVAGAVLWSSVMFAVSARSGSDLSRDVRYRTGPRTRANRR